MAEVGTRAGFESFIRFADGGAYVKLRVSPGAKSTGIKGLYGEEAVRLSIAAPPVEGRANMEVKHYLARLLRVSCSEIAVVKGTQSRDKLVFVRGLGADELWDRLSDLL